MRVSMSLTAVLFVVPAASASPSLRWPLDCEAGRSCVVQHYVDHDPGKEAQDYHCGTATYDGHDGTDIRLPSMAAQKRGVAVLATAGGTVLRVRDGVPDVSVAAQGRDRVENIECGNGVLIDLGEGWEAQYCHMAKGSLAVHPGDKVKTGDRLGLVGLSGLTEFPHLHLTIRKDGKVVDPFAYGAEERSCNGGSSLWAENLGRSLDYEAGHVLNKGFAPGPVTMGAIEAGMAEQDLPTTQSPALVAFVRAINLKGGDQQVLILLDPDGTPVARNDAPPLDRTKAQWMMFAGLKRPAGGFRPGLYRAIYKVTREGKPAIEQAFGISLRP
ncbi:M23 family metallopeptidase [Microvirga puerhi]|uniref:M23 family metallopeptidase n=1 Tax=Microvirga puerhi TaxID=2876078 RepID=A0ABS7VKH5_9HYPH|nr:M23 family metallopeptidase [Microvirga puerhi]MBZ6075570.1 M23 family metallopeptidase [Microvirga puerhi]